MITFTTQELATIFENMHNMHNQKNVTITIDELKEVFASLKKMKLEDV